MIYRGCCHQWTISSIIWSVILDQAAKETRDTPVAFFLLIRVYYSFYGYYLFLSSVCFTSIKLARKINKFDVSYQLLNCTLMDTNWKLLWSSFITFFITLQILELRQASALKFFLVRVLFCSLFPIFSLLLSDQK